MTHPNVLSADTLTQDDVKNPEGKDLGKVKEIMLDVEHGRIAYAVLSFGGFMGLGEKLFALPWSALRLDTENKCFILDVPKEQLKEADGFDADNWPNFADPTFHSATYERYGQRPYWN